MLHISNVVVNVTAFCNAELQVGACQEEMAPKSLQCPIAPRFTAVLCHALLGSETCWDFSQHDSDVAAIMSYLTRLFRLWPQKSNFLCSVAVGPCSCPQTSQRWSSE